jgi:hypothetical protein
LYGLGDGDLSNLPHAEMSRGNMLKRMCSQITVNNLQAGMFENLPGHYFRSERTAD